MARDVDALDLQKLKVLLRRFDKVGLRLVGRAPKNSGPLLEAPQFWYFPDCVYSQDTSPRFLAILLLRVLMYFQECRPVIVKLPSLF